MKKVFIVDGNSEYRKMFADASWEVVRSVHEADLIQFTGGADVLPQLYGEENTHSHVDASRDIHDISIFRIGLSRGIPMAGICRGGQFLNVMSGGAMRQHVIGHAVGLPHAAVDISNGMKSELMVTSTHHQMMIPGPRGKVLMEAAIVGEDDVEAVYYPHTLSLCFQPHPEFYEAVKHHGKSRSCREKYFEYLRLLFD